MLGFLPTADVGITALHINLILCQTVANSGVPISSANTHKVLNIVTGRQQTNYRQGVVDMKIRNMHI